MIAALYKNKKELKSSIGKPLLFHETSMFGPEYKQSGTFAVVGPSSTDRRFYATVTMENGLIKKVQ